ncbi:hypothetical protein ABBQ32_004938 [Trebouxia sp. C0010 RCD-2024]
MQQGNTPSSTKPTLDSSTPKHLPISSMPQAPFNVPSLDGEASAKPPSSFAAAQGKTAAAPSKDSTLPEDSSGNAGTDLPLNTDVNATAGGTVGSDGAASTISAPLSSCLGAPSPAPSSFVPPFSTPPPSAAPTAPASTSNADLSQSSATPHVSTSGTGFPAPFGFGAPPTFGTPASSIPKPFAFGTLQQPPGGASSPVSFGIKTEAPTFGSPQSFAGLAQPPQLTSPAPLESKAAVPTSSLQPTPQPLSGATPFTFGSSQAAFGSNQAAFGSGQPAFGSSQAAFGSSQTAFGSSLFAFGSSQAANSFGQAPLGSSQFASSSSQAPFGSSQPALGSAFAFASSQPAAAGFGSSQTSASSPVPLSFGQVFTQPSLSGSDSTPATTTLGVFKWGPPITAPGADAAAAPAAEGNASLPTFSFSTAGQNGFGTSGPQGNGDQEEEEQAQPEEPVAFEMTKGVLLRQDITWRHRVEDQWSKSRKGKVLVYHPEGDAQPHLQLQTSSGQVVSTARVSTALKQQGKPHQLICMLAVTERQVDAEGAETFSEQKVLMTLISCASAEAAKELAEKAPAPSNS